VTSAALAMAALAMLMASPTSSTRRRKFRIAKLWRGKKRTDRIWAVFDSLIAFRADIPLEDSRLVNSSIAKVALRMFHMFRQPWDVAVNAIVTRTLRGQGVPGISSKIENGTRIPLTMGNSLGRQNSAILRY
jgi:hypothetical protein